MKQQIQSCQFDGRNYGIDIMKILSAFMVVFYHFGHRKYEFFEACNYVPNINYILQTLVAFSIPLFFMVNEGTLEDRANRIEQRRQKYSEYEQKCLEEIEQLTKQRDEALEKQEVKK